MLKLIVLLGLVALIISSPSSCSGGASRNGVLSADDLDNVMIEEASTETFFTSLKLAILPKFKFVGGLTKTFFGKKLTPCYDKNVCQLDCTTVVPGCKKNSEYFEFYPTTDAEDINVYTSVCITRVYENPTQSAFFTGGLVPAILKVYPGANVTGPFQHYQEFEDLLMRDNNLNNSPIKDAVTAILNYAKLYRAFVKVCQVNSDWANQLDTKITAFLTTPQSGELSVITAIRSTALAAEARYLAANVRLGGAGIWVSLANWMRALKLLQYNGGKANLRASFRDRVVNSSPPVCQCAGFDTHYNYAVWWNSVLGGRTINFFFFRITFPTMSTPNYLNSLYPPRKQAVQNYCRRVCQ